MGKTFRTLFALAVIATLCAFTATMAFADEIGTKATAANAPMTFEHVSYAGSSVDVSNISYTISLTPQEADADVTGSRDASAAMIKGPVVLDTVTASDGSTRTYTDAEVYLNELLDITKFSSAGVYKFLLSETHAGGISDNGNWLYGNEQYYLRVWVVNSDGNKQFSQFAIFSKASETGNGTNDTIEEYEAAAENNHKTAKAEFSARYNKMEDLTVTKSVTGKYGNKGFDFPVEVTLYVPGWFDTSTIGSITTSAGDTVVKVGDWTEVTDAGDTKGMKTVTYRMSLHDAENVTFNVPVGTYFNVTETSTSDATSLTYTPSIKWGDQVVTPPGTN